MAENHDPAQPHSSSDPLFPTPLTRRSQAQPERLPLPADIEEQFNSLRQSVQLLSAHFLGEPEPPATENPRDRTVRRIKKFQRLGSDERPVTPGDNPGANPTDVHGASTAESAERLALNKHIAWPRQTEDGEAAAEARPHRWWEQRPTLALLLGAQAFGLFLLVAGYFIGLATSSPGRRTNAMGPGHAATDLFDDAGLTGQALQVASDGLQAEHSREPDKARKIYEAALTKHVNPPGINYRLALLAVQRNDRLEAEQRIERSRLDGENVADGCYVLARLAADKGDYEEASTQFERATQAQPFVGKYFFYWGEMLRRQGKPQAAAVAAFAQALVRPYTPESGDLYLFKQRLAKVEFGHDDDFNAELADHLKATPVAAEWLLLAAAQELDRQAYPAAAEHLRLAADRMPSALYAGLTHDYFFQTHAKRSEVAPLLSRSVNLDISSAGPTVLDPLPGDRSAAIPGRGPPPLSRASLMYTQRLGTTTSGVPQRRLERSTGASSEALSPDGSIW